LDTFDAEFVFKPVGAGSLFSRKLRVLVGAAPVPPAMLSSARSPLPAA
jgi:hypothetical protein